MGTDRRAGRGRWGRLAALTGVLAALALPAASLAAPSPPAEPASPLPSRAPVLRLAVPDAAATVGRSITLQARLVDPQGSVASVRFTINGRPGAEIPRVAGQDEVDFSDVTTPVQAGRVAVLVEGRGAGGQVVVRDILWLKAVSPYTEKVQVQATPMWGDLIPRLSLLHQHPVVSVHSYNQGPRAEDDRFGPNQRPVHVVLIVDGKGFGPRLAQVLETLGSIGDPAARILRARDEVGILVVGDAPEVRRDFRDGSLAKAVATLAAAGGSDAGSMDLGILLRSIVND